MRAVVLRRASIRICLEYWLGQRDPFPLTLRSNGS